MRYGLRSAHTRTIHKSQISSVKESQVKKPALDPLHVLPYELIYMILLQIKPEQIFALRRVSRAWNAFLQDERLVEESIRSTESPNAVPNRRWRARLNAFKAHRAGLPTGLLCMARKTAGVAHRPSLHRQYLAFVESHNLHLTDLRGKKTYVLETDRYIHEYTMTDEYTVCASGHQLTSFKMAEITVKTSKILRWTPAGKIDLLAAHGHHLAVLDEGVRLCLVIIDVELDQVVSSVYLDQLYAQVNISVTSMVLNDKSCRFVAPVWGDQQDSICLLTAHLEDFKFVSDEVKMLDTLSRVPPEMGVAFASTGQQDEYYLVGVNRVHYGVLGSSWQPLPPFHAQYVRWRDNIYCKFVVTDHMAIGVVQEGEVKHHLVSYKVGSRYGNKRLLVNDSFLVIFHHYEYDVLTFDGPGIRPVPKIKVDAIKDIQDTHWSWTGSPLGTQLEKTDQE